MPPALVSRADIVELDLDRKPVTPNAPRLNGERYIHCEVYKARPDGNPSSIATTWRCCRSA